MPAGEAGEKKFALNAFRETRVSLSAQLEKTSTYFTWTSASAGTARPSVGLAAHRISHFSPVVAGSSVRLST